LVVATVVASAAALFVVVEAPVVSQFFGGTPIGPDAWAVVLTAAAIGTLAGALASRWLGNAT
jgi:cation-transporting ATPase I